MRAADARVDGASLSVFRFALGMAGFVGACRYMAYGWLQTLYVEPRAFLAWPGLEWLPHLPGRWMVLHYLALALSALALAFGWRSRLSAAVFCLLFSWVEAIDQTNYLNHYYFISLVSFLLVWLPSGGAWNLDRRPEPVPAWAIGLLRFQVGVVYAFAGIAKLEADWLLRGEPLFTWMGAHSDWPLVGGLFLHRELAVAMSVAGCLFDLGIVPLLLWRRSRALAYGLVLVFHVATGAMLNIGIFPLIMMGLTPIFFEPDWPWRLLSKLGIRAREVDSASSLPMGAATRLCLGIWVLAQLLIPLRHLAIPGDVRWTEEGWRFSWRVMLVEKRGWFRFRVDDPASGQRWVVRPDQLLTERQLQQASMNPQVIAQIARNVAKDFASRGYPEARVYADAWCSMNGRPAQRLIDPSVDLAAVAIDWWGADPWIVPLESGL